MATSQYPESAKIYAFPAGGRAGVSGRQDPAKPVNDLIAMQIATQNFSSSWYHEAAIREAETPRKR
ncbi:DUF2735 domain-containing protein [Roseixanthobacter glucoisosaccharinicivorans]|uniref:DUF2735 domain-containing protein n=1 Tax=Roseixanthobacter glucoisosaccharinicivorans TaxID=3119923 RepID=UPI0037296F94